jgi:HAD superfamily hydrolase (TIGR01549 family)
MLKAVLFDLDGTLLGNNMMEDFVPPYFAKLSARMSTHVQPERLVVAIRKASNAIAESDGSQTNEEAFAEVFYAYLGKSREALEPHLMDFYVQDFPNLRKFTHRKPAARRVVEAAFAMDYKVAIATNPFFPEVAIQERMRWAGVHDFPYDRVTTYENSHFAKPDLRYFEEVLEALACAPSQALMVGDQAMDMVAAELGCRTFLVPSGATESELDAPDPDYRGKLIDVLPVLTREQPASS